jgi:CO/xanthine dehydrogenase Mo-binding subunit
VRWTTARVPMRRCPRRARRRPATVDGNALDSWLRIAADGCVTARWARTRRHGHLRPHYAVVAEELDVPIDRVTIVMGDTATDRGPARHRRLHGIMDGGSALRRARRKTRGRFLHASGRALRSRGTASCASTASCTCERTNPKRAFVLASSSAGALRRQGFQRNREVQGRARLPDHGQTVPRLTSRPRWRAIPIHRRLQRARMLQ